MNLKVLTIIAVIIVIITIFLVIPIDIQLPENIPKWGLCEVKENGKVVATFDQRIYTDTRIIPDDEPIIAPSELTYSVYGGSGYYNTVTLIDSILLAHLQIYPEDTFNLPIKTLALKAPSSGGTARALTKYLQVIYTETYLYPFSGLSPGTYSVRLELTGTPSIVVGGEIILSPNMQSLNNWGPTFKIEVI